LPPTFIRTQTAYCALVDDDALPSKAAMQISDKHLEQFSKRVLLAAVRARKEFYSCSSRRL
jgi:hypothetical protein